MPLPFAVSALSASAFFGLIYEVKKPSPFQLGQEVSARVDRPETGQRGTTTRPVASICMCGAIATTKAPQYYLREMHVVLAGLLVS